MALALNWWPWEIVRRNSNFLLVVSSASWCLQLLQPIESEVKVHSVSLEIRNLSFEVSWLKYVMKFRFIAYWEDLAVLFYNCHVDCHVALYARLRLGNVLRELLLLFFNHNSGWYSAESVRPSEVDSPVEVSDQCYVHTYVHRLPFESCSRFSVGRQSI